MCVITTHTLPLPTSMSPVIADLPHPITMSASTSDYSQVCTWVVRVMRKLPNDPLCQNTLFPGDFAQSTFVIRYQLLLDVHVLSQQQKQQIIPALVTTTKTTTNHSGALFCKFPSSLKLYFVR